MRKRIYLSLILSLIMVNYALGHTLILGVYGNDDDTITVEGKFDTGATARGAEVRLESLNTGAVLFKQRLPQESELTVKIPEEPYRIILDGGPGHVSTKEGIPPKKGFTVKLNPQKQGKQASAGHAGAGFSSAYIVTLSLVFCFLFLTLYLCMKNTNRIIEAVSANEKPNH